MNTENIPLQENYSIVVIWPGTIIESDQTADFEEWILTEFGTRVQYLESIKTNPDPGRPGSGGRIDAFFAVHNDDIPRFAYPKIQIGARWLEDVYFNNQGHLYPERVKEYLGQYMDKVLSEAAMGISSFVLPIENPPVELL